jgi:uncharacterized protein
MELKGFDDKKIKERAIAILGSGRPGWDIPHTLAAVHWIKELLAGEGGDGPVLICAAYLHDIGYSQVEFANNWDGIHQAKNDHMVKGAAMASGLIKDLSLSEGQQKEIVHLIEVHDKLEMLSTKNEILLFEADSLGQIDKERVRSTFTGKDLDKFLYLFEQRRMPRFATATGKKFLARLWPATKRSFS